MPWLWQLGFPPNSLSSSSRRAWPCPHGSGSVPTERGTLGLRVPLTAHPIGQSKTQGQPRVKKWGNRLLLLMGEATQSFCKACGYRKEEFRLFFFKLTCHQRKAVARKPAKMERSRLENIKPSFPNQCLESQWRAKKEWHSQTWTLERCCFNPKDLIKAWIRAGERDWARDNCRYYLLRWKRGKHLRLHRCWLAELFDTPIWCYHHSSPRGTVF